MKLVGLCIIVILLVATSLGWGWYWAYHQASALTDAQETPARIVDSSAVWVSGNSYAPVVTFRFSAGGKEHTASNYAPLSVQGSQALAQQLASAYAPQQSVTAYVNPADPDSAYLTRIAQFDPYWFILAPMLLLLIGVPSVLHGGMFSRAPRAALKCPNGWYALQPQRSLLANVVWLSLAVGLWYTYGLAAAGHYFWIATPGDQSLPMIAFAAYALAGGLPAFALLRRALLMMTYRDPQLETTRAEFSLQRPVIVRLSQPWPDAQMIEHIQFTLACDLRNSLTSQRVYSWTDTVARGLPTTSGQTLLWEHEFQVRLAMSKPSSPFSRTAYPRTDWSVEVLVSLRDGPTARWVFPILMTAEAAQEKARPRLHRASA